MLWHCPTTESVTIALRTQQIVAYESGLADTVDPLGGSYYVEALTNKIEAEAWEYIKKIDEIGGAPELSLKVISKKKSKTPLTNGKWTLKRRPYYCWRKQIPTRRRTAEKLAAC